MHGVKLAAQFLCPNYRAAIDPCILPELAQPMQAAPQVMLETGGRTGAPWKP